MVKLDFYKLCELYQVPSFIKDKQLSQIEFIKVFKLGLLKSEVNKRVVHGLKTPLNGWLIRKKSDEDWFEPEEVTNKPRCIEVFDTETGVTRTFKSIRETERELGVFDRLTITLRISDGKPLGKYIVKSLLT